MANSSPNTASRAPSRAYLHGGLHGVMKSAGGATPFESYREQPSYREHLVRVEGVRMRAGPTATQLGPRSLASLIRRATHEGGWGWSPLAARLGIARLESI